MRKILVSAYACEPYKGSEQAVGWNIVLQLAKNNVVHVITRANNADIIEQFLSEKPNQNLFFHYYDIPSFLLKFKNKEKGIYLYYIIWQICIVNLARKLVREYNFDYIYHVTFGSIWLPSFLFLLKPRFIWGPVGGGETIPPSFIKTLSLKGQLLQYTKTLLLITVKINPLIYFATQKASAVFCRTNYTLTLFSSKIREKCLILTDGAIEKDIFNYQCNYKSQSDVMELIVTSRFIHTKNISTIIKSLEYLNDINYHLTIVGSGPEEKNIRKLIHNIGVGDKVTIIHRVPRKEIFSLLSKSDIYLFASLKESCNLSLLEAMAIGLPVICLNWAGMAVSTDDKCAIRLQTTNPEQMPKDMANAIIFLLNNPDIRLKMGQAGRQRVKKVFNWEAKGDVIDHILDKIDRGENFV